MKYYQTRHSFSLYLVYEFLWYDTLHLNLSPPPCSTIRLWNLREEIYISFSIFIIKMYIYVYFHRSATRNTYCVTTHQPPPPHTLHPLPSPSITSDLQEVLAYASLFIRTWGREYVVCNMRATSRAYFFLLLHSTLHSPLA